MAVINNKAMGANYKFVSTPTNKEKIKYHFTDEGGNKLSFANFIQGLKNKNSSAFQPFIEALNNATDQLEAYFWECPPVSEKTLNRPFEFVAIKSETLANMKQNYSSFDEYINNNNNYRNNDFASFLSKPGTNQPSDAILVIPVPRYIKIKDNIIIISSVKVEDEWEELNYKNISQFTKNAPEEQQQALWKEVAEKLMEELKKGDAPRWLSTHGLGVHYLHVRIDERPKYYNVRIKCQ